MRVTGTTMGWRGPLAGSVETSQVVTPSGDAKWSCQVVTGPRIARTSCGDDNPEQLH